MDHPDRLRTARETVQARLALASTIIWFAVVFGAAPLLGLGHGSRAPLILALGFGVLLVAALPWLAYHRLVESELRRSAPGTSPPAPDRSRQAEHGP